VHRRASLDLRDRLGEGPRFTDQALELFYERPAFERPGEHTEESLAQVTVVRSKKGWHLFWKRGDGEWHRYPPGAAAT
jgi:hypothetical protein